jgi:hypothetical protein
MRVDATGVAHPTAASRTTEHEPTGGAPNRRTRNASPHSADRRPLPRQRVGI